MVKLSRAVVCCTIVLFLARTVSTQECIRSLSVPIDSECNIDNINVAACAASEDDAKAMIEEPWDFEDLGVLSESITAVASSCQTFYESFCGFFGGSPREGVQCQFFCEFLNDGMRNSLDECNVARDCRSSSEFYGLPPSLCVEEYMYAFTSSCKLNIEADSLFFGLDEQRLDFTQRLSQFIIAQEEFENYCPPGAQPEVMTVETIVDVPPGFGNPLCYDRGDCDFACYNHGFTLNRTGEEVTMRTNYQGECDCSTAGSWRGLVVYPSGYTLLRMRNRDGVELVVVPLRFSNEFFVVGSNDGDVCIFSWQIVSGTMFGLPASNTVPTTPTAVLAGATLNDALSPGLPDFAPAEYLRRVQYDSLPEHFRKGNWDWFHRLLQHTDVDSQSCSPSDLEGLLPGTHGGNKQRTFEDILDELVQETENGALLDADQTSEIRHDVEQMLLQLAGGSPHGAACSNAASNTQDPLARMRAKSKPMEKPEAKASSRTERGRRAGAVQLRAVGTECPRDESDCRFACITAGFEVEAYGPAMHLTSKYEGEECDCKEFFTQGDLDDPAPAGMTGLIFGEDSDSPVYVFPGAVDFAYQNEIVFDVPDSSPSSSYPFSFPPSGGSSRPPSSGSGSPPSSTPPPSSPGPPPLSSSPPSSGTPPGSGSGMPPSPSSGSGNPSGSGYPPFNSSFPPFNSSFPPFNSSFPPFNSSFPPFNSSFPPFNSSFPPFNSSFPPFNSSFPPSNATNSSIRRRMFELDEAASPFEGNDRKDPSRGMPPSARRNLGEDCLFQGGSYYNVTHKCYVLVPVLSNFSVAADSCATRHAELAIIETEGENSFVLNSVLQGGSGWIGLQISSWTEPSVFDANYVNGEPYVSASWGWYSGEPSASYGCVEFSGSLGGWTAVPCDATAYHVCSVNTCGPGETLAGTSPFSCAPCPPGTSKPAFGTHACNASALAGYGGSSGGGSPSGSGGLPGLPGSGGGFSSPASPSPSLSSSPSLGASGLAFPNSSFPFSGSQPLVFPSGLPSFPLLAPPGERGEYLMDVVLRRFGEGLLLELGGVCAYSVSADTGQVLGMGKALSTAAPVPSEIPSLRLTMIETDAIQPSEGCAAVEEECGYSCFTSEFSGVSASGTTFLAFSENPACECVSATVSSSGERFEAPGWAMEPDVELNALKFTYQGEAATCEGFFNVTGGSFLGIPRAAALPGTEKNESGPEAITKEQAEAAATGLTVGVATAVGAAVAGAVGGAVGGAAGGAAAGAGAGGAAGGAGGGGASAGGVPNLVFQAQFLAVSGRVGGPDGQPESSQALSEGMGWANFHLFTFGNEGEEEEEESGRRAGRRAQREDESDQDYACRLVRDSPRELGGTSVMCVIAIAVTGFLREGVCALLHYLQRRRGMDPLPPKAAPFPSWEMQVFLMQFMGLAESVTEAVASGCLGYEIGGAVVLLVMLLVLAAMILIGVIGIVTRRATWKHIPLGVAIQDFKNTARDVKDKGFIEKVQGYYAATNEVWVRGEWEQAESSHKVSEVLETRFVDRFGKMFDGYHSGGWWYGFWNMFRALGLGLVLGAIFNPKTNAVLCTILGTFDILILLVFHPDGDWWQVIMNVYRALMNLTVVVTTLAFINDTLSLAWFTNIFQYLSIFSIIPQLISSLFGGFISAFSGIFGAVQGCKSSVEAMTPAAQGGMMGAVAGVVVAAGDKEVVMESLEEMKDHKKDGDEGADGAAKSAARGQQEKGGRWLVSEQDVSRGVLVDGILPNSYPQNGGWADESERTYPANVWNRDENQLVAVNANPMQRLQHAHRFPYEDASNMYMGYDGPSHGMDGHYYGPGQA